MDIKKLAQIAQKKEFLYKQFEEDRKFSYCDGLFYSNYSLIAYLSTILDEDDKTLYLPDLNRQVIKIDSAKKMRDKAVSVLRTSTNKYREELDLLENQ